MILVAYSLKSNEQVEIEEPLVEISLQTVSSNGTETLKFLCNKNQLQVRIKR